MVVITTEGGGSAASPGTPPVKQRYQLPQTSESITAKDIQEKVNVVDTPDAVKYMPSLFVRKRNAGDTQPVLATRTSGVGASARSLVYADDILLSALIANNNTIGAPRWGLVAPEEIKRVDFLYGPFSAAYPGNSVGRRAADHDADAGQARDHGQADRSVADLRFLQDEKYLPHRPDQRVDRRQEG